MIYTMYRSKSLTKYNLTMSKVPIKSLNNIALQYYIYDKQSRLMYKGNYQMCKVFIALFKYKIVDIVSFCGMYRYAVWSIEEWIKITKENKDNELRDKDRK